ncbi:ComEC family competence protein [Candidatus Kuenenbacteria bacterium]|nr:ComEC family competence protein [Candidatus Kuenenbacteria bacterium]
MTNKILPLTCSIFIIGIGSSQIARTNPFYCFIIFLLLIIFAVIFWQNKKYRVVALLAAFFVLGMWRYQITQPIINKGHVAYYNNQTVQLTGQIVAEPDGRVNGTKLTMGNIVGKDGNLLGGKILLSAENYPSYQYGDWLKFTCELERPEKIEDFDYGKYLAVKGIYSVCYRPEDLTLVDGKISMGQKIYRKILAAKKHYREILNTAVVYPHSELLNGLVLGVRAGIPEKILQNFKDVGLTHIIAISGMNITIIAGLMMNLFIALGLRRGQAFYAAVGGLILFLLIIGWQASAVRAGIMGFIVLLAEKTGRLSKATRILLLAAVIILMINPQALLGDVGFQLSFLAVLGIMYFDAPLQKFLTKLRVPEFLEIKSSLKMTLAAQILVLPILVYYFGNLSLVAPVANILIVPLLPFVTILGFVIILAGLIWLPLALGLGLVARIFLGWIIWVAQIFARLPGAGIGMGQIDVVWVIIIYMIMGWLIFIMKSKTPMPNKIPNQKSKK